MDRNVPVSNRRLPAEQALIRISRARHRLVAELGQTQLVMLGLGVMVGGGIYSLAGQEAATHAGPAVIVSFVIGAAVCLLAGLCYAELSSTLPVAGGVYTFSYVAFGEVWAWVVGWALLLELLLAASVVARVFSQYLLSTLDAAGLAVPDAAAPLFAIDSGSNVVAPLTVLLISALIALGTRLTGRAVAVLVVVKIGIVVVLVAMGARLVRAENFTPFVPDPQPVADSTTMLSLLGIGQMTYGVSGIVLAAGAVVFAYVGFDLVSTAAEDAREPRRSVPRAILIGIGVVTVLYVAMAVVLVGLRPSAELGSGAPFVDAMQAAGAGSWVTVSAGLGALIGTATVVIVVLTALSRVLFAMGRDGLLPGPLAHISRWNSPAVAVAAGGLVAAALSAYSGILEFANTLVLAALFTFLFCAIGVLRLRRLPDAPEVGFRIPLGPAVPVLAVAAICWLALNLDRMDWLRLALWLALGAVVYLVWGARHSALSNHDDHSPDQPPPTDGHAPRVGIGRHRAG